MVEGMSNGMPCITGLGYCLPAQIRTNDDPIFDWLKKHNPEGMNLFKGYDKRHVLSADERLIDIMIPAALDAVEQSGLAVDDIDVLLGVASYGPYWNPNALSLLHSELQLPKKTWVIPVENTFSNYNACLLIADAMIRAKRCKNVLVCVAGDWTRKVSYHTAQAVSAADGAGAAVISPSGDNIKWRIVDSVVITETQYYGSMFSAPSPVHHAGQVVLYTEPYFQITEEGIQGFEDFGVKTTPKAALEVMQRNGLAGSDIALISHQASSVLMDAWASVINPAQYINTIKDMANMAVANVSVNMAWSDRHQPIQTDHLVILTIGPDMHAAAVLLQRGG